MANKLLFVNNASSTLLANVGPTDTAMVLPNGNGAKFPNPSAGQSFYLTVEDTSGNLEIVEATSRTNDVLTVIRGRDGTVARAFTAGTFIEARVTAATLSYLDYQGHAGLAQGSVVLDDNAMVPQALLTTPVQAIGDARYNLALGFTPVQQGGGTGMNTDKVYVGWRAAVVGPPAVAAGFSVQHGTDAPQRVITNINGNVVLASDRFFAQTSGVQDAIKMGSAGVLRYASDNAVGVLRSDGTPLYYITLDGNFQVPGGLYVGGVPVSLNGHTHTTANITDFAAFAATCMRTSGTNNTGNIEAAGYVRAAGGIFDSSDTRLKTAVKTMTPEDAEAIVRAARPVRYHDKRDNKPSIGFIADELESIVPELVPTDSAGMRGVMYQRLTAPAYVVLQSLLTERDLTRARLSILEAK